MYQRGDHVLVEDRGRRSVLVVWEDRGRGLCLSSEGGFQRALAGDSEAPLVGYPRRDVLGLADVMSDHPTEPQPLV
jgi:hypothetical protein